MIYDRAQSCPDLSSIVPAEERGREKIGVNERCGNCETPIVTGGLLKGYQDPRCQAEAESDTSLHQLLAGEPGTTVQAHGAMPFNLDHALVTEVALAIDANSRRLGNGMERAACPARVVEIRHFFR